MNEVPKPDLVSRAMQALTQERQARQKAMEKTFEIKGSWLIVGAQRIQLALVSAYEVRGSKVIMRSYGEAVVDLGTDERAVELMVALGKYFTPDEADKSQS